MNKADARAKPTVHGFIGEYRLAWRSGFQPVLSIAPDGRKKGPQYFLTEQEAEIAAWRRKNEEDQPVMLRDGETIGTPRAAAEELFRRKA